MPGAERRSPGLLWRRFWFEPGSAANLGFCRLVAAGLIFLQFDAGGYRDWHEIDAVLWMPTPLFDLLGLRPAGADAMTALARLCSTALLLTALGLATRWSAAVAAVLALYLLGVPHNYGKVFHSDGVVPLILVVLAVARSGDAWSLDRLLSRVRGRVARPDHAEYTWPVRLVWLLTALVFFAAGVAKLRLGGLEWMLSDQLSATLIGQHYRPVAPSTSIGLWIAAQPALCLLSAAGILAVELLAPLALVSTIARAVLVPALVAFTASLPPLFAFGFPAFYAMFAFWVPWASIGDYGRRRVVS